MDLKRKEGAFEFLAREPSERKVRKRDVVPRLRAVVWYEAVKSITRLNDDALDEKFLEKQPAYRGYLSTGRTRAFRSVGYFGANPDLTGRRGISLVTSASRVDKRLQIAEQIFRSAFWTLCSYPRPNNEQIEAIISGHLKSRNFYRPDYLEAVALQLRGVKLLTWDSGGSVAYEKAAVTAITALEGLDGLSLACALFQEALYDFKLERAVLFQRLARLTLVEFTKRWSLRVDTANVLKSVVEGRLLRNQWEKHDLRQVLAKSPGLLSHYRVDNSPAKSKTTVLIVPRNIPAAAVFRAYWATSHFVSGESDAHSIIIVKLTKRIEAIVAHADEIRDRAAARAFKK